MNNSNNLSKSIIYTGPSMNPTLKNLDILEVVPYKDKNVRKGDVITFISYLHDRSITHRVISVDSRGIRTLGDNNRYADVGFRQIEDIIGKVVYARRKNRRLRIYGGKIGQIYVSWIRFLRRIKIMLSYSLLIFRPAYYYLCRRSYHIGKYIPPRLKPRVLTFTKGDVVDKQIVMGKRVIGRRSPNGIGWQIKPPFRIFINEEKLNDLSQMKKNDDKSRQD
ncbi:TPA: signal peptidase I [bacterium]|nr:signal peptidase I [bacterium]